jgi:hypothetical protein
VAARPRATKRSARSRHPFNSGPSRQKQRRHLRALLRHLCQLLVHRRTIRSRPSLRLALEQHQRRVPMPLAISLRRHQPLPLVALQLRLHRLLTQALPPAEAFRLHLRQLLGALTFLVWERVQWEIRLLRPILVERRNEEVARTTTTMVPTEDHRFLHLLRPFISETRPRQRRLRRPWVALDRLLHHQ